MSSPATIKRRCVFCGGEGVTSEHVWPQWINRLLAERLTDTSMTVQWAGDKERDAPNLDTKVKRVCKSCNSGWMSVLEDRAKPILSPMIVGEVPVRLPPSSQRVLANWALKTSLMLDFIFSSQPRLYPASMYSSFFRDRSPSRQTAIWVAAYHEARPRFFASAQPLAMGDPVKYTSDGIVIGGRAYENGVISTFAVNAAVFQVASFEERTPAIRHVTDPRGAFHIWPERGGTFDWPPNMMAHEEGALDAFSRRTISVYF